MKPSEIKDIGYYWALTDALTGIKEWTVVNVEIDYCKSGLEIGFVGTDLTSSISQITADFFGPLTPPDKP